MKIIKNLLQIKAGRAHLMLLLMFFAAFNLFCTQVGVSQGKNLYPSISASSNSFREISSLSSNKNLWDSPTDKAISVNAGLNPDDDNPWADPTDDEESGKGGFVGAPVGDAYIGIIVLAIIYGVYIRNRSKKAKSNKKI